MLKTAMQVYVGNVDYEVELKKMENLANKYGKVADIIMKQGASKVNVHSVHGIG